MNSTNITPVKERNDFNPDMYRFTFKVSKPMSIPANILWSNVLKGKQLLGYKFFSQKIFNNYVVDFYCSELLMIIEIENGFNDRNLEDDRIRKEYFERLGIKTIKIMSHEIESNVDEVKVYLEDYIKSSKIIRITSPM